MKRRSKLDRWMYFFKLGAGGDVEIPLQISKEVRRGKQWQPVPPPASSLDPSQRRWMEKALIALHRGEPVPRDIDVFLQDFLTRVLWGEKADSVCQAPPFFSGTPLAAPKPTRNEITVYARFCRTRRHCKSDSEAHDVLHAWYRETQGRQIDSTTIDEYVKKTRAYYFTKKGDRVRVETTAASRSAWIRQQWGGD